jgi:NAD(P)-dependent dehydrogenase (short-subunit alcohol dehydrogenase family)
MNPRPQYIREGYLGSERLVGRVALITGGDSGIGRAVAVHFAREGADVAIAYLNEDEDAEETRRLVEAEGRRCIAFRGDLGYEERCRECVTRVVDTFGRVDILVNNAAEQHVCEDLAEIPAEQVERTFRSNIFAQIYLTKAALPHMKAGASIICTTSITAYRGQPTLVDYASTKGAILAFIRSMAAQLAEKGVRVNGVAPGPIWTPLIPASFDAERVAEFGKGQPLGRVGQPSEVAPCFVFLASEDASYMTGQVLHPNGGEPVGS